ncbi:MAG: signal peptidase I [Polyangiaceae bacterium]|nr:signal peptidase I [Polyangiaceae bacterium]
MAEDIEKKADEASPKAGSDEAAKDEAKEPVDAKEPASDEGDADEPKDGDDEAAPASSRDDSAKASGVATEGPPAPAAGSPYRRLLRLAYWTVFFVAVPFGLACLFVWALTPPSGVEAHGPFAWLQTIVREQPVPVVIVAFTVFETAIWFARHKLPLAAYAYLPLPAGVSTELRGHFERARALIDEAERLLRKQGSNVTPKNRDAVRDATAALSAAMTRTPFKESDFVDALVRADEVVDNRLGQWRKSELREYFESIVIAVGIAMALRQFVAEAFKIPSGSMIPTLQVGDHIFVNKLVYGPTIPFTKSRLYSRMPPERGDVMVFQFPEHPEQDFIKRVIATPGDTLEAKNGHPWINGWEVPSCFAGVYSYSEGEPATHHEGDLYVEFLEDEAYLTLYDHAAGMFPETQGPYKVAPGEVWVMGDNRHNSHDSRMWFGGQGGGVPFANIKGRAAFVWLSMGDSGVEWGRFGAPVMGRPRLPPAMKHLEAGLTKCLKERPPLDKTSPPPAGAAKP